MKNWKITTIIMVTIIYKSEYELEVTKYSGKYSQWTILLMQSCTTLVSSHQHKTMSHNLSSTLIIHTYTHIHTHEVHNHFLKSWLLNDLKENLLKKSCVMLFSFIILTLKFFLLQLFHRSTVERVMHENWSALSNTKTYPLMQKQNKCNRYNTRSVMTK